MAQQNSVAGWHVAFTRSKAPSPIVLVNLEKSGRAYKSRLDLGKEAFIDEVPSDVSSHVADVIELYHRPRNDH